MVHTFTAKEINEFRQSWPCCEIPELDSITFEFDSTGLIDIHARQDGKCIDSSDFDGPALLALSHEAQKASY